MSLHTSNSNFFLLYVTHVDSNGPFIKLSGHTDPSPLLAVESMLERAHGDLDRGIGTPRPESLHVGMLYALKHNDGCYYRVKVISTPKIGMNLVSVLFVDFGHKDLIPCSSLRALEMYDSLLVNLPGQANDYWLARIIQTSGRWDQEVLKKIQNMLSNEDIYVSVEMENKYVTLVSILYKNSDFSQYLSQSRHGVSISIDKQISMLTQMVEQQPVLSSPPVTMSLGCVEHVPYSSNQPVLPNPATTMRLQQGSTQPLNTAQQPSAVSQRLLQHRVSKSPVNLKAPLRQPQTLINPYSVPPPQIKSPIKRPTTFTSRLLEIGSQHTVCVCNADKGPEFFALQLYSDAEKLKHLIKDLNNRPHSSLKEPPTIGAICLGRTFQEKINCRAIVTGMSDTQCTLYFVDFGDTETVSYYDMFDIPDEFVTPCAYALRFCLSGIGTKKFEKGPRLIETFKSIVSDQILTLKVVPPEGPPLVQYGELYLNNRKVLDLLEENMKETIQFKAIEMLPVGSNWLVLVSYVDSCIKFFVQLSEKIDELNAVMEEVKVHCENTSAPSILPIGAACCAKFPDDNNWYRARIVENNKNNKVTVFYVDYGNESEVDVNDIRYITPKLMILPAQALKCALNGFESKPVESKTSNQLEMLALEKTLMAHVIDHISQETLLVTLVDNSVSPPLDVAKKMAQLSQPISVVEGKLTTPNRRDAPENFSSPESNVDNSRKGYQREKSFKEDRMGRSHQGSNEDFGQRGSSFRNRENKEGFERQGSGRSGDKFNKRTPREERYQISKPYENTQVESSSADNWDETNTQPQSNKQNRDFNHREKYNNKDEWEEKTDENRNKYGRERRDNKDWNNSERRRDATRSNFTPRERAERSYGGESDRRSDTSGGRPYKSRGNFTMVQHKELPEPVALDTPFQEQNIEANSQHEVSVTWIVSPYDFHAQLLSMQTEFVDMMNKIPELYRGVRCHMGAIPIGSSVLAKYPIDGVLYRATVLSVTPSSQFVVQYVDFGNKQLVDAKDIWQLDNQLMQLPKMAVHCSLQGVAPLNGEWKTDNEIDLCFNAPRYQCVFQECNDGLYNVSLWNNGVSVAETLAEKGLAAKAEVASVTLKDEPIDLSIIVGQQITCRVTNVDSFERFYIQLDLEKAAKVEKAIEEIDVNLLTPLQQSDISEGVHCVVKHEGKLYRAILSDVTDTTSILATLPDYGNIITTSVENLMVLPTELTVYYYQSFQCSLNNFTAESKQLITLEQLKERLKGNKFIIYISDVVGICLMTTLYDCITGEKVAIFEPDEGAYDKVATFCSRSVFNYNFNLAYISHAESLKEIYLQKSTDSDAIAVLLDELFKFYEEGNPELLDDLQVDSVCAAKSSDGNWYRATIVNVDETEVKVHFSDYGNTESIVKDNVKKLDSKFFEPCAFALCVSLGLVALQDNALSTLTEWVGESELQVTLAFGNDGWLASLHLNGVDLCLKLVENSLAAPQSSSGNAETNELTTQAMPEGSSEVYITHIDSPGQFWLQMSDKIDKIEEIQADLQANGDSYANVENRENGAKCVAKYSADDQWYRAEILDYDSDITTVRFIDYGNTDVLDNQPGVIKQMPPHLANVEPLAIKASVNAVPTGTGQWSEASSDFFTQLVGDMSAPINALIVLKDVTTYVDVFVAGQNLTDRLVSEGYATRSEENDCGKLPSCYASHISSPFEFWIQLESAVPELEEMEKALAEAENFLELTNKEEGLICVAKYEEDGAWYRAQLITDGSEGAEVLFIDFGNASIVKELRSLPEELQAKPALSRKCALQKPRNIKSWSKESNLKFHEIAAEGATVFNVQFIASGDISIVELYIDGKSITEELVNLCEKQVQSERPIPEGQDLRTTGKLCYVNSFEEFYVHLDDFAPSLDNVVKKLVNSPEFELATEFKVGSVLAAFNIEHEQWYRGKILEFCDIGYHVQFIDYGDKGKCEDFRQLPEELAAIEPLAKCCCLFVDDSDIVSNDTAINFLNSLVDSKTSVQIDILDSTKTPNLIKLFIENEDALLIIKRKLENPNSINNDADYHETNSNESPNETKSLKDCLAETTEISTKLSDTINEINKSNVEQVLIEGSLNVNNCDLEKGAEKILINEESCNNCENEELSTLCNKISETSAEHAKFIDSEENLNEKPISPLESHDIEHAAENRIKVVEVSDNSVASDDLTNTERSNSKNNNDVSQNNLDEQARMNPIDFESKNHINENEVLNTHSENTETTIVDVKIDEKSDSMVDPKENVNKKTIDSHDKNHAAEIEISNTQNENLKETIIDQVKEVKNSDPSVAAQDLTNNEEMESKNHVNDNTSSSTTIMEKKSFESESSTEVTKTKNIEEESNKVIDNNEHNDKTTTNKDAIKPEKDDGKSELTLPM